jgi:hypothetical protein
MYVVQMLQIDVKEILADAQEHATYTSLHKEDIETCAALTHSLEAVAAASSALEAAEEAILSSDLILACDALSTMHSMMSSLPTPQNEIGAGAVCQVSKIFRHLCLVSSSAVSSSLHAMYPIHRCCDTLPDSPRIAFRPTCAACSTTLCKSVAAASR